MNIKKLATVLALTALSATAALPAFAQGNGNVEAGRAGHPQLTFPMPAAEFQNHVAQREAKWQARVEKKASELPAAQAQELRAKVNERIAKVNAEVAKVTADGTVTKEEAKQVREVMPRHHHGKRGEGRDGAKAKQAPAPAK